MTSCPTGNAASFGLGALLPLLAALTAPPRLMVPFVWVGSLACLSPLGGVAARAGGARIAAGALRLAMWSALAMGVTALIGSLVAPR